jgi:hypothetical protein
MQDDEIDDRREIARAEPDRRENARRRCILAAYVFFQSDEHVLPVRVSNLSETGAKLRLGGLMLLPDKFTLVVPQRLLAFDAIVTWKDLPDLGVLFVGRPSLEMQQRIEKSLLKVPKVAAGGPA